MSMQCNTTRTFESSANLEFANQEVTMWRDIPQKEIKYASKKETVVLIGGLTLLQDKLIEASLNSLGENFVALPNPNLESFQTGKAFGNRGQCNPTYFTVGNLVKYLQELRDKKGLTTDEIVSKYIYLTAGGCGPCRFGMYITEYKKALRDAGFDGFRITSFEHDKGIFQGDDIKEQLVDFSPKFFITLVKSIIIGDIINLLGYKMRPYEIEIGSVDNAIEKCRTIMTQAFQEHTNLTRALWRCRNILSTVKLNRLQPKPKVMVMGEFWAAMTEGEGNYNLHRFLETEGAECIPQPIINRLMLSLWEAERALLRKEGLSTEGVDGIDFTNTKSKITIRLARVVLKSYFKIYTNAIGLHDFKIPNIEELAFMSKEFYNLDCEGGEGHLEVAHLLESIKHNLSHLVISVKPFGCMPSSSVSDGVQTLVTSRFPYANFLSVETSGEGAANFYSRVQMALFRAKQLVIEEYEETRKPDFVPEKVNNYLYQPINEKAGTAAQLLHSIW